MARTSKTSLLRSFLGLAVCFAIASGNACAKALNGRDGSEANRGTGILTPDSVADAHGFLSAFDGTCLFYRYWTASLPDPPQAVVLVLHGIGAHSGPFKMIGDALTQRGFVVYALDTRGHGFSCGKREDVPNETTETQDIETMVQFLHRSYPGSRIFLLGYSMGGIFALNYASEEHSEIAGLVLIAPVVQLSAKQEILTVTRNPLLIPCAMFCASKPVVSLTQDRLPPDLHARGLILQLRSDPIAYRKVSARYIWHLARETRGWNKHAAPRVDIPTLIVRGDADSVVPMKACQKLLTLLPTSDKELEKFRNVPHTALWSPETPAILERVGDWVTARDGAKKLPRDNFGDAQ